jgi:hypothetical protein
LVPESQLLAVSAVPSRSSPIESGKTDAVIERPFRHVQTPTRSWQMLLAARVELMTEIPDEENGEKPPKNTKIHPFVHLRIRKYIATVFNTAINRRFVFALQLLFAKAHLPEREHSIGGARSRTVL